MSTLVSNRGVVKTSFQPNLQNAGAEHLTLGASVAVLNPINATVGDRLVLLVTQSGGFSINWGPAFATSAQPAATGTTIFEFYYDGSKWWLLATR